MHRLLILLLPLCACTNGMNPLQSTLMTPAEAAAHTERRAQVEVFVKTNHPAIMNDIVMGGGPALTQAMQIAGIPVAQHPARALQLQSDAGLYQSAPGALVTTLMLYAN